MKLRNKRTGEIVKFSGFGVTVVGKDGNTRDELCNSLADLNAEWEDYEEPKEYWIIDSFGDIESCSERLFSRFSRFQTQELKTIGNYFETEEEAEKAVEKLKAWKRLKDGGITFKNWTINQTGTIDCFATWGDNIPPSRKDPILQDDLDLLFGGE